MSDHPADFDIVSEDTIAIAAPRRTVFDTFWDLRLWSEITSHVQQIEILDESLRFQRFRMTVSSGGVEHVIVSERTAYPPDRIRYTQTTPPKLLRRHSGVWEFTNAQVGTIVVLRHFADVAAPACSLQWPDKAAGEIREIVKSLLERNGRATLEALKARIVLP